MKEKKKCYQQMKCTRRIPPPPPKKKAFAALSFVSSWEKSHGKHLVFFFTDNAKKCSEYSGKKESSELYL